MWNIRYDTNVLTYKTQAHRHENRLLVVKGQSEYGNDGLGLQDQQMQTTIYIMDKQQGPMAQHRKLY